MRSTYTGPTKQVRDLVTRRDRGRCVRCGATGPCDIQHRINRGMGGTSDPAFNQPQNLILLCRACHEWVHANPRHAYKHGYSCHRYDHPEDVPILYWTPLLTQRRRLLPDGTLEEVD